VLDISDSAKANALHIFHHTSFQSVRAPHRHCHPWHGAHSFRIRINGSVIALKNIKFLLPSVL